MSQHAAPQPVPQPVAQPNPQQVAQPNAQPAPGSTQGPTPGPTQSPTLGPTPGPTLGAVSADRVLAATGTVRGLDEVRESLGRLDDLPVDEHVALFEQAHAALRGALGDARGDVLGRAGDAGPATPAPR